MSLHPYPLPLGEHVEPQVIMVIGLACGYYRQQIWRIVQLEQFPNFLLCLLTDFKRGRRSKEFVVSSHLPHINPIFD